MNQPCYVALAGGVVVIRGVDPDETFRAAGAALMSAYEVTPPGVHLERIQIVIRKVTALECHQAPASDEEVEAAATAALRAILPHPGVMAGGTLH